MALAGTTWFLNEQLTSPSANLMMRTSDMFLSRFMNVVKKTDKYGKFSMTASGYLTYATGTDTISITNAYLNGSWQDPDLRTISFGDMSDVTFTPDETTIETWLSANATRVSAFMVTESAMKSVANAIRTKGGTSEPLIFPGDFVSAVNAISTGGSSMKRCILRPDATIFKSWAYDKKLVEDEEIAIPAYNSAASQTLIASDTIEDLSLDYEHYKYYVIQKALSIPEYDNDSTGRGRFEWSMGFGCHELVWDSMTHYQTLVGNETSKTHSVSFIGGINNKGVYWNSASTATLYNATTYGLWLSLITPSYASGNVKISSPNFVIRGQPNILDQPFWEALTDIRLQYVIELWRAPVENLAYDGWSATQISDLILDCVYDPTHKLV